MALRASLRPARRPVYLASYEGTVRSLEPTEDTESTAQPEPDADPVQAGVAPLRYAFPEAGADTAGGQCDGYCFSILFAAGKLERTYTMVREFLLEHGYGSVPIPADVAELQAFRLPPKLRHQLSLFGVDGYVHNPIKIVFPPRGSKRGSLRVELYDEAAAGHLLRFHQRSK
ncbi:hypothetical protein LEM8419_01724 [Neolewinella maritima]|uniref:RES domain-containing protein n=1 Tax=Neolewinella maritima TaxID=1383882 RepID=A0ABM9B192_9BACT|nr:hypothetical protein [Neolewinella maritima]CAH1000590.1 hypothetical protein LEM8419_01724 [Neolewinella maritima]